MMRDRQLLPNVESATDGVVMYESNFGLHRQPFQCAELGRAFFVSESIRSILPQLLHAMRSDLGTAVMTGPAGVGKTSLLKHLQAQLKHEGRAIMCSGASLETPTEILQTLLTASQLRAGEQSADLSGAAVACTRWAVVEQMRKTTEFWGPILLLIDDAHLMSVPVLNELRAFTEEDWNGRGLVRLLIAGPLSLEEELARPSQIDFSRRIRCHAFLQPLSSRESVAFLSRHLEAVGGKLNSVFSPDAVELIASASDGLPRCISLLADEALMVAAQENRKLADHECVRIALDHLQHLAYPWNASPLAADNPAEISRDINTSSGDSESVAQKSGPNVRAASAGVMEFGSPGVIEIGSGYSFSNVTTPAIPKRTVEDNADRTASTSRVDSVLNPSFEVGHRYSPDTLESADAVEMDSIEVEEADSFESSSGAQAAAQYNEDVYADDEATEPDGAEYVHQVMNATSSEITGKKVQTAPMPAPELFSPVPVFDRYTWISLGREVPAGTYNVSSASDMQRVTDSLTGYSVDYRSISEAAEMSATFDKIPVFNVSDMEIAELLQGTAPQSVNGTFNVVKSQQAVSSSDLNEGNSPFTATELGNAHSSPYVGVELFNPTDEESAAEITDAIPTTSIELTDFSEADRQFIQNAIRATLSKYLPSSESSISGSGTALESAVSNTTPRISFADDKDQRSVWNDGQLLFNSSGSDALREAISERVLNQLTEAMADGENISFSFEAARAARDEQVTAEQISVTNEQPTDKFFSLPTNPKTVEWDLRSGLLACEEIAPLADSLASLRDEVTSFQQNSHTETGRLTSDGLGEQFSTGLHANRESLVSRAKRRLDHEKDASAVPVSIDKTETAVAAVVDRKTATLAGTIAAESIRTPVVHAAEQPSNTAQSHSVPAGASFSRLFTQLRKMRVQSTGN